MAMGSRGVDLAKQALSSVHGKVSAAVQPIIILAYPDDQVHQPVISGNVCHSASSPGIGFGAQPVVYALALRFCACTSLAGSTRPIS